MGFFALSAFCVLTDAAEYLYFVHLRRLWTLCICIFIFRFILLLSVKMCANFVLFGPKEIHYIVK